MLALSPVFSLLNAAFVTHTLGLNWATIWVGLAGIVALLVVGLFR